MKRREEERGDGIGIFAIAHRRQQVHGCRVIAANNRLYTRRRRLRGNDPRTQHERENKSASRNHAELHSKRWAVENPRVLGEWWRSRSVWRRSSQHDRALRRTRDGYTRHARRPPGCEGIMKVTRRELLVRTAGAVALTQAQVQSTPPATDPTRVRGKAARPIGQRAPSEQLQRTAR